MASVTSAPIDSRYLNVVPTGARRAALTGVGLRPTRNLRFDTVRSLTAGAGLTATEIEIEAGVEASVPSEAWKVNRSFPEKPARGV